MFWPLRRIRRHDPPAPTRVRVTLPSGRTVPVTLFGGAESFGIFAEDYLRILELPEVPS